MSRLRRAAPAGAAALLALCVLAPTASSAGAVAPLRTPTTAAPAPASAGTSAAAASGTIVFVRDHDVWIARPDGSGARAVTRDGTAAFPYGSPSQSDAGVIVATHIKELVRMTQQGRVLNRIDPGRLPLSNGETVDSAPLDAAISPDGRRIAYTLFKLVSHPTRGYRYATAYTASDRLTDPAAAGTTYHWAPSWVGNHRTLQHGGAGSHVNVHDVGGADQHWFAWSLDLGDTGLSDDGRWLAGILGFGEDAQVAVFEVDGDATSGPPPAAPAGRCSVDPQAGTRGPTFGPDHQLAWEQGGGIWIHPDVSNCLGATERLVIPRAGEPHWSPAPLSAPATSKPALRNTTRPSISGRAATGRVLRARLGAWTPRPTSYVVRWLRAGKVIAGATRTTYRPVRADRGRALSVRVTARRTGHREASATSRAVRVRR